MLRTSSTTVKVSVESDGPVKVTVKVNNQNSDRKNRLIFGKGNAKLDDAIFTFSLPAGHCCPFARACKSQADREAGRITDGPHTEFRCFAATGEARGKSVRESRWKN